MRLALALMTGAMLATTAAAQSIAPEFQSRSGAVVYAPAVEIAPAIAAPTPIATASVDRAEFGALPAEAQPVPTQGPIAGLVAGASGAATGIVAGDDRLQSVRKSRTASVRSEPKKPSGRTEAQPVQRYRPVASGIREFGRFWPPVF